MNAHQVVVSSNRTPWKLLSRAAKTLRFSFLLSVAAADYGRFPKVRIAERLGQGDIFDAEQ